LPGSQFSTSTRLKNSSADVEVNLGAGTISVAISLMEGVKAGLRSFQKKVYTGSGPLPPGSRMCWAFVNSRAGFGMSSKDRQKWRVIF
jgi:hypothetical protein